MTEAMIKIPRELGARFDSAREKMSKAFGFTLSKTQIFELMIIRMEEDIESKGVK
jgi:hypothetical protein|tara:strand:+ start:655 stop:819 length:165 start_codon:yes stop_codon:yes gene_type:complete